MSKIEEIKRLKQTFSIQSTPGERFYSTQIGTLRGGGQLAPLLFLCRMKTMLLLKSQGGGGRGGGRATLRAGGGGGLHLWMERGA